MGSEAGRVGGSGDSAEGAGCPAPPCAQTVLAEGVALRVPAPCPPPPPPNSLSALCSHIQELGLHFQGAGEALLVAGV